MIHLHHRPLAVAVALCVTALAPLGAAAQSTTNLDAVEVTGTASSALKSKARCRSRH